MVFKIFKIVANYSRFYKDTKNLVIKNRTLFKNVLLEYIYINIFIIYHIYEKKKNSVDPQPLLNILWTENNWVYKCMYNIE